jgi:hypothetical protein
VRQTPRCRRAVHPRGPGAPGDAARDRGDHARPRPRDRLRAARLPAGRRARPLGRRVAPGRLRGTGVGPHRAGRPAGGARPPGRSPAPGRTVRLRQRLGAVRQGGRPPAGRPRHAHPPHHDGPAQRRHPGAHRPRAAPVAPGGGRRPLPPPRTRRPAPPRPAHRPRRTLAVHAPHPRGGAGRRADPRHAARPAAPAPTLPQPWPGSRARQVVARCWAALHARDRGGPRPTLFRLYADITREAAARATG